MSKGVIGMLDSVAGAGLVLVLFLFFAPRTGIGGGDIKMMMAVGALMGVRFAIWAMLFTAVTGGALALLVMASHGALFATVRTMMVNLYMKITFRSPLDISSGSRGLKFKYSPAIAIGSFLVLWLKPWTWT
jgi:prepilin peptidase CpaA